MVAIVYFDNIGLVVQSEVASTAGLKRPHQWSCSVYKPHGRRFSAAGLADSAGDDGA
jgi:hypothetical protein